MQGTKKCNIEKVWANSLVGVFVKTFQVLGEVITKTVVYPQSIGGVQCFDIAHAELQWFMPCSHYSWAYSCLCSIWKYTSDHHFNIPRQTDPSQGTSNWKHSHPQGHHFLNPHFQQSPGQTFIYLALLSSAVWDDAKTNLVICGVWLQTCRVYSGVSDTFLWVSDRK